MNSRAERALKAKQHAQAALEQVRRAQRLCPGLYDQAEKELVATLDDAALETWERDRERGGR